LYQPGRKVEKRPRLACPPENRRLDGQDASDRVCFLPGKQIEEQRLGPTLRGFDERTPPFPHRFDAVADRQLPRSPIAIACSHSTRTVGLTRTFSSVFGSVASAMYRGMYCPYGDRDQL
jgi:hypothetical protein